MAISFANSTADLSSLRAQAVAQGDGAVLSAVTDNIDELQQLYDRMVQQCDQLDSEDVFEQLDDLDSREGAENTIDVMDENIRLRDENARLNQLINQYEAERKSATQQCQRQSETAEAAPMKPKRRVGHLPKSLAQPDQETAAGQQDATPVAKPVQMPVAKPVQMTEREISAGALTWEQRKALIIEQLENDSFDAEEFLSSLNVKPPAVSESQVEVVAEPIKNPYRTRSSDVSDYQRDDDDTLPIEIVPPSPIEQAVAYVKELHREMEQLRDSDFQKGRQISKYDEQVAQLKQSIQELEQQLQLAAAGVCVSSDPDLQGDVKAAMSDAVNKILDNDQLVQQERERLRRYQESSDQKLREIEISSSLERAKLSCRCRELEHQNHALEAQLESLQRSLKSQQSEGVGTKWMAKLGLVSRSDD